MKSKAIVMALLAFAFQAQAVDVSQSEAAAAVRAWVGSGEVLGTRLGSVVDGAHVRTFSVSRGAKFHAVPLTDGGTVFTSADTESDPVVLFTREKVADLDPKSPLYDLLERDAYMRMRLRQMRLEAMGYVTSVPTGTVHEAANRVLAALTAQTVKAEGQWAKLLASAGSAAPIGADENIHDLRVKPLVTTKWSQAEVGGEPFYNYYVDSLVGKGLICGCTATAAAQILNYFKYPGVGAFGEEPPVNEVTCQVNGKPMKLKTLGGTPDEGGENANGYDFDHMPDEPAKGDVEFEAEQRAVGSLTYDCAVALASLFEKGGTGAYASNTPKMYRDQFGYRGAFVFADQGVISGVSTGLHDVKLREKTIYANLDAGKPVQLGIYGYEKKTVGDKTYYGTKIVGHSVVADGYGFTTVDGNATAYVHVNLGWAGQDDAWYNIPEIDTASAGAHIGDTSGCDFLYLGEATFNIVPGSDEAAEQEGKEILSGRVLDEDGLLPFADAQVTVYDEAGNEVATAEPDENGIYAVYLAGGGKYEIWARSNDGKYITASDLISVGRTSGDKDGTMKEPSKVGNVWGVDLCLSIPEVRIGDVVYPYLDKALQAAEAGDTLEILLPARLKKPFVIDRDLTIVATNEDARASAITRYAGAFLTITNGVTLFTNVVFAASATTPVTVTSNGVVQVSGVAVFDDLASFVPGIRTQTRKGFQLAGELLNGLTLECDEATTDGATFGYYGCDPEAAKRSAVRIVSAAAEDRVGFARDPDVTGNELIWKDGSPIGPDVAVVALSNQGGDPAYYRTFDSLLDAYAGEDEITVLRDNARLTKPFTFAKPVRLAGLDGIRRTIVPGRDAGFTVGTGAELDVTDLAFANYRGNGVFVVKKGGRLSLSGCAFSDIEGTNSFSGAVAFLPGSAALTNAVTGTTFTRCRATGAYRVGKQVSSDGGAIYVGTDCGLKLEDSEIDNCSASEFGGGVFVGKKASLLLSGAVKVAGNTSGKGEDDIYLQGTNLEFAVVGELDGDRTIGVCVGGTATVGQKEGEPFASVGVSEADAANSAKAFFSDNTPGLVGSVSEDAFVWTKYVPDARLPSAEIDEKAAVQVIGCSEHADGCYATLKDAFDQIDGDATIRLLKDVDLDADVTLVHDLMIVSTGETAFAVFRLNSAKVTVPGEVKLSLTNVIFAGAGATDVSANPLFNVSGGVLAMGMGAEIRDVWSDGARNGGAISVWNNGTFRMTDGVVIRNCRNNFIDASDNSGRGGAVRLDSGIAYLEGGEILECFANRGGGVFLGNGAEAYVSGGIEIHDNFRLDDMTEDNFYAHQDGKLYLKGEFTGAIGYTEGVDGSSNEFGWVVNELDDATAQSGAHHFTHDANGDIGMLVKKGDERLLVWSDALDDDGKYGEYELVAGNEHPIAVPEAVPGLVADGTEKIGVMPGLGYELSDNTGCGTGVYTAVAKLRPGFVWSDGTFADKEIEWRISDPTPPPPPPGPIPVPVPHPIYITSLTQGADRTWTIIVNPVAKFCKYTLYASDDLESWDQVGEPVISDVDADLTFTRSETDPKKFWKVVGENGEKPAE